MKEVKPNPQSLFQRTKEWIAIEQKANMDKNISITESGKTPLNLLIEDVKADAPKYIKKLKVATAAAMIFGGNLAFNPNVANVNKTESNASSKTEAFKSDPIVSFTNSVFETGGKYNSMSKGGTPIAIKHALQNDQKVTGNEVQTIFSEAAQINNGKTNPINQKEVKIKMSYYNNYINQGMNREAALLRATVECHVNHPEISKGNSNDFKVFLEVAQKCGITIESQKETIKNYISQGMEPQESVIKATLECIDKHPEIKNANLEDIKVLRSVAKKCGINLEPKPNSTKTPLQTLKEQNQVPKVAPSIFPTPELQTKLPEKSSKNNPSESKPSFDQWVKDNQKSIDDFLKATGMLTIAGVATAAGLTAVHKMYKKYQQWEATLPPMMTKAEVKANFWTNMERFKQSELAQKIKNQTQKAQRAAQRLVSPESTSSQLQSVETNINPNELRPGIGQKWSNFIRGFRNRTVSVFSLAKNKIDNARQSIVRLVDYAKAEAKDFAILQQTRSRENGVIASMKKDLESSRAKKLQELNQRIKDKENRPPIIPERLPGIDYAGLPKVEDFVDPEEKRKFSNHDIQAYLLIAENEFEIFRKQTPYYEPAKTAIDYLNKQIKKDDPEKIVNWLKRNHPVKVVYQRVMTRRGSVDYLEYAKKNEAEHRKVIQEGLEYSVGWITPTVNRSPVINQKTIETLGSGLGDTTYNQISFENYLIVLAGLKKYYKNKPKMLEAIDIITDYTLAQEHELVSQNVMRMELARRKDLTHDIENVNGTCEEMKTRDSISRFCNEFTTSHDFKATYKARAEEFVDKIGKVCDVLRESFYIYNEKGNSIGKIPYNKVNFVKASELLDQIEIIIKHYKIKKNSEDDEVFGLSRISALRNAFTSLQLRLKYPPNSVKHAPDIFETDVIPKNSKLTYEFDGSFGRRPSSYLEKENGGFVAKYPTSLMFPEVLENAEFVKHVKAVAARNNISLNVLEYANEPEGVKKHFIGPKEITDFMRLIKLLNDPKNIYWSYRPFRVKKSPVTEDDLKKLYLGYKTNENSEQK